MNNYVNEHKVIKLTDFVGFFLELEAYLIQPLCLSESTFKQQIFGRVKFKAGSFQYIKNGKNLN